MRLYFFEAMRFFILYVPKPAATARAMHPTVIAAVFSLFLDTFFMIFSPFCGAFCERFRGLFPDL